MDRLLVALVGAGFVAGAYVAATMAYARHDIVFENASLGQLAQSVILSVIFFSCACAGVRFIVLALTPDD
jgi:hypothetical protein